MTNKLDVTYPKSSSIVVINCSAWPTLSPKTSRCFPLRKVRSKRSPSIWRTLLPIPSRIADLTKSH